MRRRSLSGLRCALAAKGTPALPALAAVVALAVSLPAPGGGGRAAAHAARAPDQTAPRALVPPPQPARYRIVGCRAHGDGAYRYGPDVRAVAIGFDDGPAADTSAFVAMLERARARATFFMIGRQLGPVYGRVLLRELRDGDVLGDHSFTHPDLTQTADVRGQLQRTLALIRALSGYTPCLFRPPYGAYDASVLRIARSLGLATVLWNVDPRDWARPGAGAIVHQVLRQVRRGSIIISHDGGGPRGETLAAYPRVIADLRARGYRIVTIPELLGFRPIYRPCVELCDGIGLVRAALPADAIIERAT